MAGFVGGAIGATIGFFFGNPMLGWAIGSGIASALYGTPRQKGPRLSDLNPQTSEYGRPIPILYGDQGVQGNVIWSAAFKEEAHDSGGGKGGGGGGVTTYTYRADFAVLICEGVHNVTGIFAGPDKRVIYDGVTPPTDWSVALYPGDESQLPDPLMESYLGVGQVPAYRGYCYAVFQNYPLEKDGNRLPFLMFEFQNQQGGPVGACGVAPSLSAMKIVRWADPQNQALTSWVTYVKDTDEFWVPHADSYVYSEGVGTYFDVYAGDGSWKTSVTSGIGAGYAPAAYASVSVDGTGGTVWSVCGTAFLLSWSASLGYTSTEMVDFTPILGFGTGGGILESDETTTIAANASRVWVSGYRTVGGTTTRYLFSVNTDRPHTITTELSNTTGHLYDFFTLTPDGKLWYIVRDQTTNVGYLANITHGGAENKITVTDIGVSIKYTSYDPVRNAIWMWFPDSIKRYDIATNTLAMSIPLTRYSWSPQWLEYDQVNNLVWARVPKEDVAGTTLGSGDINGYIQAYCPIDGSLLINYPVVSNTSNPKNFFDRYRIIWQKASPAQAIYADAFDDSTGQWVLAQFSWGNGNATLPPKPNPPPYLDEILTDLHKRSGLTTATLDVSDPGLHVLVEGYQLAKQLTVRDAIETLRPVYFFDGIESNNKVKFVSRGGTTFAAVIADDELMAHDSDAGSLEGMDDLLTQRQMELELPRSITVTYLSGARKWDTMSRMARRLTGNSKDETTMDLPLSMNETQAQSVAEANLHLAWVQRLTYSFQVGSKYAALEPTDLVSVHGYGMRIVKVAEQPKGIRQFDAVRETSTPYNPTVHVTELIDARVLAAPPVSTQQTRLELM